MLFMAELLPNGLHEKVMIYSICYKSRLDVWFVKKIPLKKSADERKGVLSKLLMVFTLNVPFICYLKVH